MGDSKNFNVSKTVKFLFLCVFFPAKLYFLKNKTIMSIKTKKEISFSFSKLHIVKQ